MDKLSERSPKFTIRHRNYKILKNKSLDRFYTDQNLNVKEVEHLETKQYLDHIAGTIEVCKEGVTDFKRGSGYWKMNNTLLENKKMEEIIKILLLATETEIH